MRIEPSSLSGRDAGLGRTRRDHPSQARPAPMRSLPGQATPS